MKSYFQFIVLVLLLSVQLSAQTKGTFKDPRDSKVYRTVKIGEQTWFAENLSFKSEEGCRVYDKKESNAKEYGRLYTFEAAKKACPSGWHLPTKEEFEILVKHIGGNGVNVYNELIPSGSSGFDGLFGGFYTTRYEYKERIGHFWSATEINAGSAWYLGITSFVPDAGLSILDRVKNSNNKVWGFSVRCIKD